MKQIIFDLDMIPAVIEGRKTVVRYPMDPQPRKKVTTTYVKLDDDHGFHDELNRRYTCPYGKAGDKFFLRDRWRRTDHGYELRTGHPEDWMKDWRGVSMMPKAAARHWLQITEVYAERLGELSELDAMAEGLRLPREIARVNMWWNYETNRYNLKNQEESLRS